MSQYHLLNSPTADHDHDFASTTIENYARIIGYLYKVKEEVMFVKHNVVTPLITPAAYLSTALESISQPPLFSSSVSSLSSSSSATTPSFY
ncbi:unnamed protein product [Absidia cylindrospora]